VTRQLDCERHAPSAIRQISKTILQLIVGIAQVNVHPFGESSGLDFFPFVPKLVASCPNVTSHELDKEQWSEREQY
jgi:hypothetical protein